MAGLLFVFYSLCSLLLLERTFGAPACSPEEPPIVVQPVARSLEDALRSLDPLRNCTARLYLLSGVHVISSSVSVSTVSVVLSSHPNNTGRSVVRCGDSVSHPGDSVNETEEVGFLTFWNGTQDVSIAGVDFEGCPRTVQFIKVDNIDISDCTFRNFTQGPVNMYNCQVVTVSASTFENNHALSVFTDLPSRVSGGGLSITIIGNSNGSVIEGTFNYTIQYCTFSNNSAISTIATAGTSSVLGGSYVNRRGGGVGFYIVHPSVVTINVLGCNFTNNHAAVGGGLFIFSPELVTEEDFTVAGNHFEGNSANSGGAIALGAVFQQTGGKQFLFKDILMESVIFDRNTFVRNSAIRGGAMFLGPGLTPESVALIGTYEISSNVFQENMADDQGAAVTLPLFTAFTLRTQTVTVFKNNTFDANNCRMGGILNAYYYPVHFQDRNRFVNNIGSCVQAAEALIEISGDMLWMGNDAPKVGAAVYLTSHAQLRLHPSANLTFVANKGSVGSAIFANHLRPVSFLTKFPHNPLCFLTYSNISILPQDQEVSLNFINNTAQVGSAMYLQNMEYCSSAGLDESSLPLDKVFRSDRFHYSGNENTGHPPDARGNTSYDISTPVAQIDIPNNTVFAFAHGDTSVVIRGLDELGNPTAGTFSIVQEEKRELVLLPTVRVLLPSDQEYRMRYIPLHEPTINDSHVLTVRNFIARATASITLIHGSCPAGFEAAEGIIPGRFVCQCTRVDANILSCNRRSEDILLRDWSWATPITNSDGTKVLFTTGCSYGYCRCQPWYTDDRRECRFTVSQDLGQRDQQCTCNRQGFLCGNCVNGTGVTALLNRCEACNTANVTLIVFLVLINAAFFLGILLYSLVKPIHLAAWWYPILFYIQVASYSTVNFPVTFNGFHSAMFYLGSLLGLYFPYDFCLYPNATAVEVYAIKYIPFIVALVVCTVFGMLTRCIARERLTFSGIWLIATLLINPAIFTSYSILRCSGVSKKDGRWMKVWHYDGTIECSTEGHLPLVIWAGVVLLLYITFSLLVPTFSHILLAAKLKVRRSARLIAEAAAHPYSEDYRWWSVVDVLKRLLVIRFAVFEHRTSEFQLLFLSLSYFLYAYARPYKATYVNIIEVVLLAYLGIFLSLSQLELQVVRNVKLDNASFDSCGNEVPSIKPGGIALGVVYFLPVSILVFFLGRWLFRLTRKCWLRVSKWYRQLLLSQKSQLEPVSELDIDLDGDLPQSEVTLVANHSTNRPGFRTILQRSVSTLRPLAKGGRPALDQGAELTHVTTGYSKFKERPDSASLSSHSNTSL